MQYYTEPAICPNCGKDTIYHVIVSCNSFMMDTLPSNECSCGYTLSEEDIDLSRASPYHREIIRNRKISDYAFASETSDFKCANCGCTKSSGWGLSPRMVPDKYKDDEGIRTINHYLICSKCGHRTIVKPDTNLYDLIERLDDGTYICLRKDNYEDMILENETKEKEQLQAAEDYLVSIGEITSKEEEDEYADKYFGRHIDRDERRMIYA